MTPAVGDHVMIEAPRAGGIDLARVVAIWPAGIIRDGRLVRGEAHTAVLALDSTTRKMRLITPLEALIALPRVRLRPRAAS